MPSGSAYLNYESQYTDEFVSHFLNKDLPQFWKVWNSKFRKKLTKQVNIGGSCNNADIANSFAENFKSLYASDHLMPDNEYLHDNYSDDSVCDTGWLNVEIIDQCIDNLKRGKLVDQMTSLQNI